MNGPSGSIAAAVSGFNFADLQKADPANVPVWHQLLLANDPGQFPTPAPEPLLVIHGGNDEQIPQIASELMFGQLCKTGQGTERWLYPGQSHAGVIGPSLAGGATAAIPIPPVADLLIGSASARSAAAGDVWPTSVGFTAPLPAVAAGHYPASVTFTVVGR